MARNLPLGQGLTIPDGGDSPAGTFTDPRPTPIVVSPLEVALQGLESRVNLRFADSTARDAVLTGSLRVGGIRAYLTSSTRWTEYDGAGWKTLPRITAAPTGTAPPTVNVVAGDLFFTY